MYKIHVAQQKGKVAVDRVGEARTTAGLRFAVLNMLDMLNVTCNESDLFETMQSTLLCDKTFRTVINGDINLTVRFDREE